MPLSTYQIMDCSYPSKRMSNYVPIVAGEFKPVESYTNVSRHIGVQNGLNEAGRHFANSVTV